MTTTVIVLVLALVVAWLTAAATAVRSVSRIWLRHWAELRLTGSADATLRFESPQRFLLAAGTGVAGTVFAIGALVGLREEREVLLQHLLFAALLLLVVGQLVPRAIARRWATVLAPVLMPALRALEWVFTPLLMFVGGVVRRFTSRQAMEHAGDPRDALEDLLREGEMEGVGEPSESAIISGVVEFGEKRASDVMTPRQEIVAVEREMPAADISRLVAQAKYSRVPVYESSLDNVVGLVHSFDVLAHPEAPAMSLRKVVTARADTLCHGLMRRMLREHVHLAIIQGDSGDTLGLVTLEDLVEELVGDISDEHDEPQAAP